MSEQVFDSSDAVRTASPLHYARQVTFDVPVTLELGGRLPSITVTYETYGQLSPNADNAVLVCHAISGDSHVASHRPGDDPGWWELAVGPGKIIDTDRYFVICPNVLGGCRGTTGPNSVNPDTGRPYGADFPAITIGDMVDVQARLLDHLGIDQLLAVVGGSLGGHQAITWATRFPRRVRGCAALATSPRLTSQALAFDIVGRNAILRDPAFHGGQYYNKGKGPTVGLALARMLGHITYLSREAMMEKFDVSRFQPRDIPTEFEKKFSVGSYLAYQGHKFVERFDANSYLTLTMAMDLFDLGDTEEKLQAAFRHADCRWLVVSFTSDWLFPPFQSQQIVDALVRNNKPVSYCNVVSNSGHDAFLLDDSLPVYGGLLGAFLANLDGRSDAPGAATPAPAPADPLQRSTRIFQAHRLDYERILDLIPPGASVLDLGCGQGELLSLLKQRDHARLVGAEIDEQAIVACVQRSLDVVQVDLNQRLRSFTDGQFDVVVLSQTLQSVIDTEGIVDEIVRVGRKAIVSLPNFAYHKLRRMLADEGRSPKAAGQYSYEWYNTPNRRYPSIADFIDFCRHKRLTIQRDIYLDTAEGRQITDDPNLNADLAIFVLSR